MAGDLHVDMQELAREVRLVDKKFATALRSNMRKAVSESGSEITAAVRAEASWSKRIPGATSLATSFGAKKVGVQVKVNAKKAPHGRPLESGSKGNPNTNRHPVFGKKGRWVDQPTRPFFFAVAKAMTPRVEGKIQAAIDTVAIEAGFKGR